MALFISLFFHCLSVLLTLTNFANGKSLVPCYFIFGDSLSDNGNNNHLSTLAKVDFSPYGIDFPKGPTGRFTNGRTMHDFIVGHLGFKVGQFIPPYADTKGQDIRKGVNYASGSAGIRNETGKHLGVNIHLNQQMEHHKTIIKRVTMLMKNSSATKLLLNRCIYSVQIGSNDYLNNYFLPYQYNTSLRFTLPMYTTLLVEHLSVQLKALYNDGARKIVVYGIGKLGCTPYTNLTYGNNRPGCVPKLNEGASLFNDQLRVLVVKLNNNLSDATFTYINPLGIGLDFSPFEMTVPCCEIGGKIERGGGELCLSNSTPCSTSNRTRYIFWDGVHPTEAWNEIAADIAYSSPNPVEAYPFNIKQLVMQ